MEPVEEDAEGDEERTDSDQDQHADTDSTGDEDPFPTPPQSHSPSFHTQEAGVNVFGVFSFGGCRYVVRNSELPGYEDDEEGGGSVSRSPALGDVKDKKRPTAEVPRPSIDSQRSTSSPKPGKPHIPPRSSTIPQPSKRAGKRRQNSGTAVLDKHLGYSSDEDWGFAPVGVGVNKDQNGPNGTSLFARGVFDRYRLTVHHGDHTTSGVSRASGTEVGSPLSLGRQGRGRTTSPLSSWNRKNTSHPDTNEKDTLAHSNPMDWRESDKSGFTDSSPERTRGPRLTRPRLRPRNSRSGSISEGHQSPEDDGESKKKVDWYDV